MNGPSHPGSPPSCGFSKKVNDEKYAFKVVNISGICQSHLYVPIFLLPAGGAIIIMEYWPLDLFRAGLLSNMWSLGKIKHFMPELHQLLFLWRDIKLCHSAMDTPFNKNSRSPQFTIAKAFRLDWPEKNIDVIKFLGVVRYSVKHDTSCCQQVALWL